MASLPTGALALLLSLEYHLQTCMFRKQQGCNWEVSLSQNAKPQKYFRPVHSSQNSWWPSLVGTLFHGIISKGPTDWALYMFQKEFNCKWQLPCFLPFLPSSAVGFDYPGGIPVRLRPLGNCQKSGIKGNYISLWIIFEWLSYMHFFWLLTGLLSIFIK